MAENKTNIPDLETEKLQLEIGDLKTKIFNSKKTKAWDEYIKPIMPIAVTLIIAVFGTVISAQFNGAQLKITESKHQSDKEIAQINASLSYIKILSEISDSSMQTQQQALSVIAPILPPETSFSLAINALPENQTILKILIEKYDDHSWKFIVPYLEHPYEDSVWLDVGGGNHPISLGMKYTEQKTLLENNTANNIYSSDSIFYQILNSTNYKKQKIEVKYSLLSFLESKQLIDKFEKYIFSDIYISSNRAYTMINYIDYVIDERHRVLDINYTADFEKRKISANLITIMNNSQDVSLIRDIAIAGSYVFPTSDVFSYKIFIVVSAKYFWDNLDVSIGEVPASGSLEKLLWDNSFQKEYWKFSEPQSGRILVREALFKKLMNIDYSKASDIGEAAFRIFASYSEKGRDSSTYLLPNQSVEIMKKILSYLKTNEQKRDMALFIGSGHTHLLFESMISDSVSSKVIANLLIEWYSKNRHVIKGKHDDIDGEVIKNFVFFSRTFPDLKEDIDKKFK